MRCELPCLEASRRMIGFGKIPTVGTPNIQSWELLHCIQPDLVNDIGSIDVDQDIKSLLKFIPGKFLDLFSLKVLHKMKQPSLVCEISSLILESGHMPILAREREFT